MPGPKPYVGELFVVNNLPSDNDKDIFVPIVSEYRAGVLENFPCLLPLVVFRWYWQQKALVIFYGYGYFVPNILYRKILWPTFSTNFF